MSILSKDYFHDEAAAFVKLESIVWPDGPVCPHCGCMDRVYDLKGVRSKPSKKHPEGVERYGLKKCGDCRKQFTVRVGTVFESSHVPLHKWLQAVYLICASKKGISANQLHRTLEVTLKTAWFMAHRIREAMKDDGNEPLGGVGKLVEADETYIGNSAKARREQVFINGKGWVQRGPGGEAKHKVVSLVERGGKVRSVPVAHITANAIRDILDHNVDRRSGLRTDESNVYMKVGREFASHETVNHSRKEWARGDAHTNTLEGYFSIFKRGMRGVYQHCSERHLHRYLAEFDFRYNGRDVTDSERADSALSGVVGKRLTYRRSDKAKTRFGSIG